MKGRREGWRDEGRREGGKDENESKREEVSKHPYNRP